MAFQKYAAKKDPDSVIDYGRDWIDWLGADTIIGSVWFINSDEEAVPTLVDDSSGYNSTSTSVWLSGGTEEVSYDLTNRITTLAGRTEDRTGVIKVEHK